MSKHASSADSSRKAEDVSSKRLGPSFHRTFPLSRPAIGQLISLALLRGNTDETTRLTASDIRAGTTLGSTYVEAIPRYAQACGLLDISNTITDLGRNIHLHDPSFVTLTTQWVLHYRLVSPAGIAPSYWPILISTILNREGELTRTEVVNVIQTECIDSKGQLISRRIAEQSATVFLGSYVNTDGLSSLLVLHDMGKGHYLIADPSPIPPPAFAYILADYWEQRWPGVTAVAQHELTAPDGLAPLLLQGGGNFGALLGELAQRGLVDLERIAPPWQVVRRWQRAEDLLEGLYDG